MRTGSVAILAFIGAIALVGVAVSFGVPDIEDGVGTFDSPEEFRQYLDSTEALRSDQSRFEEAGPMPGPVIPTRDNTEGDDGGQVGSERDQNAGDRAVSRTNVQHEAIDEPDIVKTDGETISISRQAAQRSNITLLDALPAEEARVIASVRGTAGDWWGRTDALFLHEDTLIAIGETEMRGYDVSDPGAPEQQWQKAVNGTVETARMDDGRIYLVIREGIDRQQPCPVQPFGPAERTIPCTSIHHPRSPSGVDVTYSVLRMGPDGAVEDATSFLGSRQETVVYMSENGLYLTYGTQAPRSEIMMEFFSADGSDLLDEQARVKLQRLAEYDISEQARLVEVQSILQAYRERLGEDRRPAFEQDLENRFGNWTRSNLREFVTSGIVRVGLDELEVRETGEVPGIPLNRFSLDEHDGHLRIATTVTGPVRWGDPVNDLYILDEDLDVAGSVQGMGIDQRISSVRFLDEEGYIVTHRRIDPFYVLNLSDLDDPVVMPEEPLGPSEDTVTDSMETTQGSQQDTDRYMRVLEFGARVPDIDLYENTSREWLPENRWKVKEAVDEQNPIQYMLEVSEEVPEATYPEYDPTEEELEAAWGLYNRTYEHAREEGWFTFLNGVGDGYQDIKGDRHYHHREYVDNENNLDPTQPEVLMYYRDPDNPSEQILAGVMYLLDDVNTTSGEAVDDDMGPLSIWHYHQYDRPTCAMRGLVPEEPDPGLCPSGIVSTRSPEMLHLWFIDHPDGQLASKMSIGPDIVEQPEKMTENEFKEKMRGR